MTAQDREISVTIDGEAITFDVPPMMIDNHAFVPFRAIFEAHGAVVSWDEAHRSIEATRGNHMIQYSIDAALMNVDGKPIFLERTAVTVNNRTLVPLRAISEALGSDVKWDSATKVVTITTTEPTILKSEESSPITKPKLSFKVTSKTDINLKMTTDVRSKVAENSNLRFEVHYYGVKENRFYTALFISSHQDKDMRVSFAPGDKKIIAEFSKLRDPMPSNQYNSCMIVSDNIVYDDSECTSNNAAAAQAQFEEWQKNNFGISEEGSDQVTVRREIQAADGSLKDYIVPANDTIILIINSPLLNDDTMLTLDGSYYIDGSPDKTFPITLEYEVDKNMGLGLYDLYLTGLLFNY
ncbi:hypothetical protein PCCS19_39150 [Paenibacillus sp. CCS19]|uniref:copper amine oxidase N-terminal domain-containing protein n=1 Tax=Paenibacillus sp. CCS19 TaxID=3158387 RepID=UPI0025672BE0|nr:copper amine oxidase N-terminal domain-containing protein [Paenibacillus cellulosilyticus]GMK40859.1 hypothetical protein PCCS19_39150 [Paenibacillus cellulosilyticus]